jgi:hypothetical protein
LDDGNILYSSKPVIKENLKLTSDLEKLIKLVKEQNKSQTFMQTFDLKTNSIPTIVFASPLFNDAYYGTII